MLLTVLLVYGPRNVLNLVVIINIMSFEYDLDLYQLLNDAQYPVTHFELLYALLLFI